MAVTRTDLSNELITGSANGGSVGYARGSDGGRIYVRSQRIHGSLDSIG